MFDSNGIVIVTDEDIKKLFLETAELWIGKKCSTTIQFLAIADAQGLSIWNARITLSPLPLLKGLRIIR